MGLCYRGSLFNGGGMAITEVASLKERRIIVTEVASLKEAEWSLQRWSV